MDTDTAMTKQFSISLPPDLDHAVDRVREEIRQRQHLQVSRIEVIRMLLAEALDARAARP